MLTHAEIEEISQRLAPSVIPQIIERAAEIAAQQAMANRQPVPEPALRVKELAAILTGEGYNVNPGKLTEYCATGRIKGAFKMTEGSSNSPWKATVSACRDMLRGKG